MSLIASDRYDARDLAAWRAQEQADGVYCRTKAFARKVQHSLDALQYFADKAGGRGYVGVSWGKDSVVVAHLAHRLRLPLPFVWVRVEPVANPDCVLVRDTFLARFPVRYDEILVECPRDASGVHSRGTLERGFGEAVRRHGDIHISGVRAEESGQRMRRMKLYGPSTDKTCAPIGWWTATDVYAYLYAHDLPVHPAYACTMGGALDRARVRVASLGGRRGDGHGRATWEWRYYPDEMRALGLDDRPR